MKQPLSISTMNYLHDSPKKVTSRRFSLYKKFSLFIKNNSEMTRFLCYN